MGHIGVTDAAKQIGVTPTHVRRLLRGGSLKGEMVGSVWVIDERSLDAFLRKDAKTADQPRRGRPRGSSNAD